MRTAPLVLASLLAACSSASSTPPAEQPPTPPVVVEPPTAPVVVEPPPPPPAATGAQVRITMTEQPVAEMPEMPRHEIRVLVTRAGNEETIEVGVLNGCALGDEVTPGSLATLRCWWAGGGDTVEVLTREDALIVTRQEADSQAEGEFEVRELGRVALGGATVELAR